MAPLRSHELRLLSALLVTTWYAHRDIRTMERVRESYFEFLHCLTRVRVALPCLEKKLNSTRFPPFDARAVLAALVAAASGARQEGASTLGKHASRG